MRDKSVHLCTSWIRTSGNETGISDDLICLISKTCRTKTRNAQCTHETMPYPFDIDPSLRAIFRDILASRIAQSLEIELANASVRCSRPVAIWRAFDESASTRHGLVWIYGPTATLQRSFKCMRGGLAQPYAAIGRHAKRCVAQHCDPNR